MKPLMQAAQEQAPDQSGDFKKPDLRPILAQVAQQAGMNPEQLQDQVDRIVAAGMKLMYSPEMQQEVHAAIQSPDPVPKKLADNTAGLLLTLDQQAQGGIPEAAIFPAGMELLGEAAEVLATAGQKVTDADFQDASRLLYATLGQKLGLSQDELMGAAQQAVGDTEEGEAPDDEGAEGEQGMQGMPMRGGAPMGAV